MSTTAARWVLSRGMLSMVLACAVSLGMGLSGCSDDEAEPAPPEQAVADKSPLKIVHGGEFRPPGPLAGRDLRVEPRVTGGRGKLQYTWLVDGTPVAGQSGATLPGSYVAKGASISVQVQVAAGAETTTPVTIGPVNVANMPPRLTNVSFKPTPVTRGREVVAEVTALDPDSEDPPTMNFVWFINDDEVQDGESNTLDLTALETPVQRGDTLTVAITPDDGEDEGQVVEHSTTIQNAPPVINTTPKFTPKGDVQTYRVRATDADGDALTYKLEAPHASLAIDSSSGVVTYTPPGSDAPESIRVHIVVEDSQGATDDQIFDIFPN